MAISVYKHMMYEYYLFLKCNNLILTYWTMMCAKLNTSSSACMLKVISFIVKCEIEVDFKLGQNNVLKMSCSFWFYYQTA